MITRGSLSSLWLLLMLLWTNVDCGWQCLMSRPTTINKDKQPISPSRAWGSSSGLPPRWTIASPSPLTQDIYGHLTMDTVHTRPENPESPHSHCQQRLSAHYSLLGSSALWLCRDSVDLKTSTLNSTVRPLTPFDASCGCRSQAGRPRKKMQHNFHAKLAKLVKLIHCIHRVQG